MELSFRILLTFWKFNHEILPVKILMLNNREICLCLNMPFDLYQYFKQMYVDHLICTSNTCHSNVNALLMVWSCIGEKTALRMYFGLPYIQNNLKLCLTNCVSVLALQIWGTTHAILIFYKWIHWLSTVGFIGHLFNEEVMFHLNSHLSF